MKLSIGIVGLPNVGKSTLFKALTKNNVLIANYPFATIDPNVGVVSVPDERLEKLATLSNSKKKIPAVVEFYDIAGLVRGASKGDGLGNQFLTHIRETSAIAMVVRCFKDDAIIHVENSIDPIRDIDTINTELALKDLETVERRLGKAESEAKSGKKEAKDLLELLKRLKTGLANGQLANQMDLAEEKIKELNLLTRKKQIYVLNGAETDVLPEIQKKVSQTGGEIVVMNLSNAAPDLASLIQAAYSTLGLISFFTTGEEETRAWTIRRGAKAPEAAGVIHTDFEKKFIRAEVIAYDELLAAGGWNAAKQKGQLRLEGKDYLVNDGDVMVIRHG